MDRLVKHALETGVVSFAEMAKLACVPEQDFIVALTQNVKLPKITERMLFHHCSEAYRKLDASAANKVAYVKGEHAGRHTDARGCIQIPKAFCKAVHTEHFKLTSVIDRHGNEVLLVSAAHLPTPSLGIGDEPTAAVMPEPEEN